MQKYVFTNVDRDFPGYLNEVIDIIATGGIPVKTQMRNREVYVRLVPEHDELELRSILDQAQNPELS